MGVQCTFTCLDVVYIGVQRACRLAFRCGLRCTQQVFCDFLAPGGAGEEDLSRAYGSSCILHFFGIFLFFVV